MLTPQWHTRTPTRGGPDRSSGYDGGLPLFHPVSREEKLRARRDGRGLGHAVGNDLRSHGASAHEIPSRVLSTAETAASRRAMKSVRSVPMSKPRELHRPVVWAPDRDRRAQRGRLDPALLVSERILDEHFERVSPGARSTLAGRPRITSRFLSRAIA